MLGAAIVGGAASALGGFLGYKGQQDTNRQNIRLAREQMGFQERMRNTSWQSAVEDMRKAGLNPALAYQQGGAATPAGASATVQNPVSSALQGLRAKKELALLDAQVKSAEAQADIDAETARVRAGRGRISVGGQTHVGDSWLGRMALLEEERALTQHMGEQLNNIFTGVNTARTRNMTRITGVGADLADTFGIFGPMLAGLLAPGGIGITSGRALGRHWARRQAIKRVQRATQGVR